MSTDTMSVTVRDRDGESTLWGSPGYRRVLRPITISAMCPVCDQDGDRIQSFKQDEEADA